MTRLSLTFLAGLLDGLSVVIFALTLLFVLDVSVGRAVIAGIGFLFAVNLAVARGKVLLDRDER